MLSLAEIIRTHQMVEEGHSGTLPIQGNNGDPTRRLMSDEAVQQGRGTVGYERKVNLGDFESETASIFVQFDIPTPNADDAEAKQRADQELLENIKTAFAIAKDNVLTELGVAHHYDVDLGIIVADAPASVEQAAVAATQAVFSEPAGKAGESGATSASSPTPSASEGKPVCPTHGGSFDNRADNDEREARGEKRRPDFRCNKYQKPPKGVECKWVQWS